jgi:hypothetical protein
MAAKTIRKSIKLSTAGKAFGNNFRSVTFFVSPEISESRNVNYVDISDIRMPASILIWMGSPSRGFNLSAKFIARSQIEADGAFQQLSLLRSWCVAQPVTGSLDQDKRTVTQVVANNIVHSSQTDKIASKPSDAAATANTQQGKAPTTGQPPPANQPPDQSTYTLGGTLFNDQTPPVLLLEGYGGQFRHIPVVIQSLNISYPNDVDYIQNSNGVWVPIIHDISISLKEARELFAKGANAPGAMNTFSIKKFRNGTLDFW